VIAVAMSGGVDSSVAAALLLEAGHDVMGATLLLNEGRGEGATCCGDDAVSRARAVADQLGIGHRVVDASREFGERVLRPAWEEYARGRTPSPCLLCNERVKFGALLDWAKENGADGIATGHYARVERDERGALRLRRGADAGKDQSYFLAGLNADQLAAIRFPLGALDKAQVREKARALGLASRDTPDSQDACFASPDVGFAEALRARFGAPARPGEILDGDGNRLGRHGGIHLFTVGQRKGLGVPATSRLWVRQIRAADAAIVVTGDEAALDATALTARGFVWSAGAPPAGELECEIQVRYRSRPARARAAVRGEGEVAVRLDTPVRAVTPGQAAVLYDGDVVLGRGWIDAVG
jgi:tRNA-uridine 2-sulfurtransferase